MKVYPSFYKALVVLVLIVLVVTFGVPLLLSVFSDGNDKSSYSLSPYSGFEDIDQYVQEQLESYHINVPDWFTKEVMDVSSYETILVSYDGKLLSFSSKKDKKALIAELQGEFKKHGWTMIESGVDECWTCIKSEGKVTWAFVQIVQAPIGSSVVLQVQ